MGELLTASLSWLADWSGPLAIGSVAMSLIGVFAVGWVVVQLPEDHFIREAPPSRSAGAIAWSIFRNLLGAGLVGIGLALLVLPGQGLVTMLLGLSLLDFPGKRTAVRKFLSRRSVRRSINWIRRKADRPPLKYPRADQAMPGTG